MPDMRLKEKWKNPAFRSKRCEAMKSAWIPERRRQARERMLGHKHSEVTKERISLSNIETWNNNRANYTYR